MTTTIGHQTGQIARMVHSELGDHEPVCRRPTSRQEICPRRDRRRRVPPASAGRASHRPAQPLRRARSAGVLPPAARSDPDLRHVPGGGRRRAGAGVCDRGPQRHDRGDPVCGGEERAARGLRPHPRQPPPLLHGLRQQQRKLRRSEHDQAARPRAPDDPVPAKAVPGRRHESVLSLRPEPVHSLRPLRRGVSERAGERDADHPVGGSPSARALGRRRADRRVELRLVRPLRDRLPLQRAHGDDHARARGFHDLSPGVRTERHDRRRQGDRAGDRVRRHHAGLGGRGGDAAGPHPAHQDRVHLLRRRLHLRRLDEGPRHPEGRARRGPGERHLHLREGQVRLGLRQQRRPAEDAARPRRRRLPARHVGRGARPGGAAPERREGRPRSGRDRPHRLLEVHQRGELPDAEAGACGDRHQQHRQLLALLPGPGDHGPVPHRRLRW